MGRLIDTDTAYEALTEYYNHHTDVQHQALEEALCMVETADAIPVEWIQRYANACEAVSKTVGGVATKLSAEAVRVMLDYWREEQNNVTDKP